MASPGSMAMFWVGLLLVDGAVVGALELSGSEPMSIARGTDAALGQKPTPADAGREAPRDEGFNFCMTRYGDADVTPTRVAISYLDSSVDTAITAEQLRAWFGPLPAHAIDVYALEHKNGRRRIAFELDGIKWDGWARAVGDAQGREVCARARAALLAAGIGRPRTAGDSDGSRYDFEFIYARRTKLWRNYTFLGTLDQFLADEDLAYYRSWLDDVPSPELLE